jgi:hypothetical protein
VTYKKNTYGNFKSKEKRKEGRKEERKKNNVVSGSLFVAFWD